MKIVIYTHTDFLDIFQIQQDHLLKLKKEDILIFTNKENALYHFPVILYDDSKAYADRLLQCLTKAYEQLDSYFVICHDNDILLHYKDDAIENIQNEMIRSNIVRIDLCMYEHFRNRNAHKISMGDNIQLIKNDDFYLYSVAPSLWNKDSYIDVLKNNAYCDYRNIEPSATEYMKPRYNVYTLYLENHENYHIRRYHADYFTYLHITLRGGVVNDPASSYKDYILKLVNDYQIKRDWYNF
jgi:hypothetical protein